jgi:IS1 family transposase
VVGCRQKGQAALGLVGNLSKDATSCCVGDCDRSEATCRKLWRALPKAYRTGICYTDFWNAYAAVIPDEQHEAGGKESGETAPIERFNNTIRQRLARFVRKTLSFSKSSEMHDSCLRLFLWRDTMEIRHNWIYIRQAV